MLILAFDTCLSACSVALTLDGAVLAYLSEPMSRGHQERLAPMAREVLALGKVAANAVDRIAVTVGPGSFTGLRVGLAFGKGLALALERPCIGIGTLAALVASDTPGEAAQAAVIDSGRGRVYLQSFLAGLALTEPQVLDLADALRVVAVLRQTGSVRVIGPGAHLIDLDTDPGPLHPSAIAIARLAAKAPVTDAQPLYLRAPDATPKAR